MRLGKQLRQVLFITGGLSLLLAALLLAYLDSGTVEKLKLLSDRVANFDQERSQEEFANKALDVMAPLASQIEDGEEEIQIQVHNIADDSVVRALFASGKPGSKSSRANRKGHGENLAAALKRLAEPNRGRWIAAEISDHEGKVVAFWPEGQALDKELASDASFKQFASGNVVLDTAAFMWVKAGQLSPSKDPRAPRVQGFESNVAVVCGMEDASGNFTGMVKVVMPVSAFFGLDPNRSLKDISDLNARAALVMQRGNGDQIFNSIKGAYVENSSSIPDLKDTMASMQAKGTGWAYIKSYDGKPAIAAWKRVGPWMLSQGAPNLFSLLAIFPQADLKVAQHTQDNDAPLPFYERPLVLLFLFLVAALPMGLGILLSERQLEGVNRFMDTAFQIDEFGAAPEGLEFGEDPDPELGKISQGLNALLRRLAGAEHRSHELDAALRRAEDQASRDATAAAQELSELRNKLASTESEKTAANAKFDAAQKARADLDLQLANLKSALETAQRSIDLKNSENKNLSAQVQDLMRTVEEQRKVAQQVQESAMRRDDELVRLSAVNTLSSELKATLTVIKNYISTMLGSVGAISDAQQEFLGVVINKSARLERLIADLVELSEIGSGIKPPRMEVSPMGALVQEALLNARPQADHKKISLDYAESGNLPSISVDKDKIGAVVRALLNQAIKVTSRGEKVSLLAAARENNVELRVTDPGMSLPPDRAAKVFNQFHGVDSQAGPEFIGTGLRFPIMRAVVEAHGGKIWIESQVGRGKTFVLSLPKAGSAAPASRPSLSAPGTGALPAPAESRGDSIFNEMPSMPAPVPPRPAPAPLLGGLPPLGAPPAPPAPLAGLPPLGSPPLAAAPKPLGPPPAIGAVPAPPPPKSDAAPLAAQDKENFDAIFGGIAAPAPGGMPKVELKTGANLGESDKANFDSIFGGAPAAPKSLGPAPAAGAVPAPPPLAVKPAIPAELASFDSIFGSSPTPAAPLSSTPAAPKPLGPPPAAGAVPAPPPLAAKPAIPADLAGFDAIFGSSPAVVAPPSPPPAAPKPLGPPPTAGAVPAPPPLAAKPALPADLSNFDEIFGTPEPPKPPAPPKAPGTGALNTLDDLKNMLGGA